MATVTDRLEQLDDDELDALIDLAQAHANGQVSRRDLLKGGGALGLGALLGGGGAAAMTQDAQAAASTTDGDGDIGTPDSPEDVFADALAVFDGANNQIGGFDETGIDTPAVNTEQIGSGRHYAGAYDGADADARLGNALSAASAGDTIYLEPETYVTNRTISQTGLVLVGSGRENGTKLNAEWTLGNANITMKAMFIDGNNVSGDSVTSGGVNCIITQVTGSGAPTYQVTADRGVFDSVVGGSVTFASGTSNGIVDSSSVVTVTDNGTNTAGDIA